MNKYVFIGARYLLYAVMGVEILLLPMLVPQKADYGNIEYFKSFLALSPMLLMGFQSGYLRTWYLERKELSGSLLTGGILLMIPVALVSALYMKSILLFFACLASGGAIFLEKTYQRDKKFIVALLYKPMLSVCILFMVWMWSGELKGIFGGVSVLDVVCIAALVAFIVFLIPRLGSFPLPTGWRNLYRDTLLLIKNGFWLNFGTMCVGVFLFLDRTYLKYQYPESLSDYSLAFSVSQILFVFFSSQAYLNEVEYGESLAGLDEKRFKNAVRTFMAFLVPGVFILSLGYWGLVHFLPEYRDGFNFLFILAPTWGFFFASGSLGVVTQYLGLQKKMSLWFAGITCVNLFFFCAVEIFSSPISPTWWILKSGLLVVAYSLFLLHAIQMKLGSRNEG